MAGLRRAPGLRLLTLLAAVLAASILVLPTTASATSVPPTDTGAGDGVTLTLFHGDGCPHCAAEIDYLVERLAPAHPEVSIRAYEVWASEENRALMVGAAEVYGFEPGPVPVTIVDGPAGYRVFVGFGAGTPAQIEQAVVALAAPSGPVPTASAPATDAQVVDVPLLGEVDLADSSVVLSTLLIGFVDGVNPCSLWVLSVLLAVVLHSGSRGRVVLVGTVFLTVTATMYAVYVAGAYSVLTVLGSLTWIRLVIAGVALAFGLLQLKDGLRPGVGPSLSIPARRRPGVFARMRPLAGDDRGVLGVVAGTVVLAVGVSLLETPCTAGLPLLWVSLLAEQGVGTGAAAALFGLYMTVFLLDELVVLGLAVVTLRSTKLQQHHGQALKIVSGSVLVTLAVAMLAVPTAMATVPGTLVVFGVAAVLGGVMWWASSRRASNVSAQPRTQREKIVPSDARDIDARARSNRGSGVAPDTIRAAAPPTSVGTVVRHSSSSSRAETTSASSDGPPSQSSRRSP